MPTYRETTTFETQYREGGSSAPLRDMPIDVDSYSFTWPASVKRSYPKDPFRAGTARVTSNVIRTDAGFDHYVATNPRRTWFNDPISRHYSIPAVIPVAIDKELIYNKIRSDLRGEATNLANMLAEYKKTAQLFMDLAKIVATRGKSLLRKHPNIRRGTANSWSKDVSSAYLGWTYGVTPLAGDLVTAAAEIRDRLKTKPIYLRGVESRSERAQHVIPSLASGNLLGTQVTCQVSGLRTLRQRVQWRAELNSDALLSVFVAHGFGNPLAVGWEVTPFSFVVDWWVNIGEMLQSLDNLLLVKRLEVIDSLSDRRLWLFETNGSSRLLRPGGYTYYSRRDERLAPREISRIVSLRYDESVSVKHIINGLALLNQLR